MKKNRFTVFYSWQSDLPKPRSLLSSALDQAAKAVNQNRPGMQVVIDQATRDLTGAPNIPIAILAKIKVADMVVCDVSTINQSCEGRKSPNPNVVFELGFSVATTGWERIVLMFDRENGKFPDDVPFDFDKHRAVIFDSDSAAKVDEKKRLSNLFIKAIEETIDKNPTRPTAFLTPEQTRHQQDVVQLNWLMSSIHIPTIDLHIEGMPHRMSAKAIHVWDGFDPILRSSYFHLHDSELRAVIDKFHVSFGTTLSFVGRYHDSPGGAYHIFTGHDTMMGAGQEEDWDVITKARDEMEKSFRELLGRIRTQYLEVDLSVTNRTAWEDFSKYNL